MSTTDIIIMFAPLALLWAVLTGGFVAMEIIKWRQE
jgi:uncharacterized protein YneF (UPF0154 family)